MFFGIVITCIGVIFLLKNIGIITDVSWSIIWPLGLIIIGSASILKRKKFWD